jgi:hypothetical protein
MLKKSKTSAEKEKNNKKDYRKIKSEVIMNSDIGKIKIKFIYKYSKILTKFS